MNLANGRCVSLPAIPSPSLGQRVDEIVLGPVARQIGQRQHDDRARRRGRRRRHHPKTGSPTMAAFAEIPPCRALGRTVWSVSRGDPAGGSYVVASDL
jgi:hypothetical protein